MGIADPPRGASQSARRLLRAARALTLVQVGAIVVVLAWRAGGFLSYALAAIRYPYQLDWVEGRILNEAHLLMAGTMIYHRVDEAPYACNYPPVYHLVTGLVNRFVGNLLATGRAVSAVSAVLTALVIAGLTWRASGPGGAGLPRGLAAAAAGLSFLTLGYTGAFAVLMRVDLLAYLLAFTGALAFVTWAAHPRKVYWCVPFFVLAVYTRQSTVAAAAACCAAALLVRPGLAFRLAGVMALADLAVFAVLNGLSDGQFYFHVVAGAKDLFRWTRAAAFLSDMVQAYSIPLVIAAATLGALLRQPRWDLRSWRWDRNRVGGVPADFRPAEPVLACYLAIAFAITLTAGKIGSDVNYLIEFMGVVCAGCGVALAKAWADVAAVAPTAPARRDAVLSAVVIPALLLWQVTGGYSDLGLLPPLPGPAARHAMAQLVDRIRATDGPVLCEDLTALALAGKRVEFTPIEMTQLYYRRRWDQRAFVQRIVRQDFALLVLRFSLFDEPGGRWRWYSPEMITAMRGHYHQTGSIGEYRIYEPGADTAARDRPVPPIPSEAARSAAQWER